MKTTIRTVKATLPLTISAVLGCALMAGLFFAFSVSVMKALGQLPAEKGMAAMQSINVAILNPLFLLVFLGTAAVCVWALVISLMKWSYPPSPYLFAGSLLYLLGVLVVTMAVNVPMNDALAAASPGSAEGAHLWSNYLTSWTAWNHVRTFTSFLATTSFALALCHPA